MKCGWKDGLNSVKMPRRVGLRLCWPHFLEQIFDTFSANNTTTMASDDDSELSQASISPTEPSNPWTKASKAQSVASSRTPAQKTRFFSQKKGIIPPAPRKRLKGTESQPIILDTQQTQSLDIEATNSRLENEQSPLTAAASNDDFSTQQSDTIPQQSTPTSLSITSSVKSKKRPRTSHIHEHSTEVLVNGTRYHQCNTCRKKYTVSGGTKSMSDHLRDEHRIDPSGTSLALKRRHEESDIKAALSRQAEKTMEVETQKKIKVMASNINKFTLEYLYLKWIINSNLPFNMVEDHDFRVVLQYVNEAANSLLPNAHSTIRVRAMQLFHEGKQHVKSLLRAAISDIHITCDLWSSDNSLGLLGVVAHFTAEDGQLRCLTLGMRELEWEHSGENQAAIILNVLDDFEIRNRLGYFMMDNAKSNDTLISIVAEAFRTDGVFYHTEQRRLRCNGHVLNLSAQAFLFGKASDDLEYLKEELDPIVVPSEVELQTWRKLGPLGKLHNLVVYIGRTPQRKQKFKQLSDGLLPHRDQKTRWNSFYEMIDWSLERIKDAIIQYSAQEKELEDDVLKSSEWEILQDIRDFLKPFFEVTLATEGRKHILEKILPSMEFLLSHYERALVKFEDNPYIVSCLDAGYTKLLKYFNIAERNSAYIAGVVLNPTRKWLMFKKWKPKDLAAAKRAMTTLWQTDYCTDHIIPTSSPSEREAPRSDFEAWDNEMLADQDDAVVKDEYERYLAEGIVSIGTSTALEWWTNTAQRTRFPLLSRMAIDILSIPAMSSEVERLFSAAKNTIGDKRLRLTASSVEAIECLKSWFRLDLFTQEDLNMTIEEV